MTVLTAVEVTDELNKIVEEYGADHVYERNNTDDYAGTCNYASLDGEPDCIVGHVLARLQPEVFAKLVEFENKNTDGDGVRVSFGISNYSDYEELGIEMEEDARGILSRAQAKQDRGETWGEAVEYATDPANKDFY